MINDLIRKFCARCWQCWQCWRGFTFSMSVLWQMNWQPSSWFHCNCRPRWLRHGIRHGHRCRWCCCYYYYGRTSNFTFCLLCFLLRFPFISSFFSVGSMVPSSISFVPFRTLLVKFIEHETASRKHYSAKKIMQNFKLQCKLIKISEKLRIFQRNASSIFSQLWMTKNWTIINWVNTLVLLFFKSYPV